MSRREAMRARTQRLDTDNTVDERREAHRLLRIERGRESAPFHRGAGVVVEPHEEFPDVAAWLDFLRPLYPAYVVQDPAVAELYEPDGWRRQVIVQSDRVPYRRSTSARVKTSPGVWGGRGWDPETGLWQVPAEEPMPDTPLPPAEPQGHSADDVRDRFPRSGAGLFVAE